MLLFTTLNKCVGYKILGLFPSTVRSHFVMFEKLVMGLVKKGHEVDVISNFPLKEKLQNYNDISIKGLLPAKQNNATFENFIKPMNTIFWVPLIAEDIGETYCDILNYPILQNIINKSSQNATYDIIITEVML